MMSSKSGCTGATSCVPTAGNSPYAAYSTACSENPITIPDPTRDYVVKSLFSYSESCSGLPLTQYVVAADYTCHPNPLAGNDANIAFFRVSCNGAMPIWDECLDSACGNCTSTAADKACMLGGAGTSNGFECIKAQALSTTSSFIATATSASTITSSTLSTPSTSSVSATFTSFPNSTSSGTVKISIDLSCSPVLLIVSFMFISAYVLPLSGML
ncbi:unnamed protein product [Sphagnum tenellum]